MMGTRRCRAGVVRAGLLCSSALLTTGCTFEFLPADPNVGGDLGTTQDTVLVRFWNRTLIDAVDVQFHATNDILDTLPDDLFTPDHQVTRSIGLAGLGILEPGMVDTISFPCTDDLTLGTQGGQFSDAETGDSRGLGVPRWVAGAGLGLCGSVVTFEYTRDGEGFTTRVRLND